MQYNKLNDIEHAKCIFDTYVLKSTLAYLLMYFKDISIKCANNYILLLITCTCRY